MLVLFDLEQRKDHNTSRVGKFSVVTRAPNIRQPGCRQIVRVHPTYFHTIGMFLHGDQILCGDQTWDVSFIEGIMPLIARVDPAPSLVLEML